MEIQRNADAAIVMGAVVNFGMWLTTRPKLLRAGSAVPVYDVTEALTEWAKLQDLDLTKVETDWRQYVLF